MSPTQQPQPTGDRDVRTHIWHHEECGYRQFLFFAAVADKYASKGGEASSKESGAGLGGNSLLHTTPLPAPPIK